jgi:hypothetical protein
MRIDNAIEKARARSITNAGRGRKKKHKMTMMPIAKATSRFAEMTFPLAANT